MEEKGELLGAPGHSISRHGDEAAPRIVWKLEHRTFVTYPHGRPALPPRPHGLPRRALAAQPRFGKHHSRHLTLLKFLFRPSLPRLCHTVRGAAQPCR